MAALGPLWARELWGAAKNLARDAGTADLRNATRVGGGIRRRPSDANWPSQAAWKRLNDEVDGNLIPVEFPIEACVNRHGKRGLPESVQQYSQSLLHRRPAWLDANVGMGGRVGEQTQRLRRGGKQCRPHRGGGELRTGK
jgi:hypothetical protein